MGYPTSCYPQAWAAAAPLLILRTLLRLEPDAPNGVLHCAPVVPSTMAPLRVDGLVIAGTSVTVEVGKDSWVIEGLPSGLRLVDSPEQP